MSDGKVHRKVRGGLAFVKEFRLFLAGHCVNDPAFACRLVPPLREVRGRDRSVAETCFSPDIKISAQSALADRFVASRAMVRNSGPYEARTMTHSISLAGVVGWVERSGTQHAKARRDRLVSLRGRVTVPSHPRRFAGSPVSKAVPRGCPGRTAGIQGGSGATMLWGEFPASPRASARRVLEMSTIDYVYRFDPNNPRSKPATPDAESAR
jgi:hypothetical protein